MEAKKFAEKYYNLKESKIESVNIKSAIEFAEKYHLSRKDNEFEVSIFKDCVQYSETDSIGFFNCPNCETQRYYNGQVGDVYNCDCNAEITFNP